MIMKRIVRFYLFLWGLALFGASEPSADVFARETRNFNDDWTFALVEPANYRSEPIRTFKIGDVPPNEETEAPRSVRLPHDWAIESGFDSELDGATGKARWRGVGVYSKTLSVSTEDLKKRFVLSFDGVMSFPEVAINGVYAGGWDYGYLGFQVDATPFLHEGDNLIKVRCDTREHRSRWYPGAGIYRNVDLIVVSRDLWLPEGSVWLEADVQPETPTSGSAELTVRVLPDGGSYEDASVAVRIAEKKEGGATIFEKKVDGVAFSGADVGEKNNDDEKFSQYRSSSCADPGFELKTRLDKVRLWDVEEPNLYLVEVAIFDKEGVEIDSLQIPFGFRQAEFTVDDGFHLNGRRVQLYGVDLHHDQGLIGAASHPAAIRRQLSIMRDMGANAIRTSHNPNSSAFMQACDEMGFVVWDELFDKWDGTAGLRSEDDFFAFSERQAGRFVCRDRNRPSVCAWSIGNEIASIEANFADASNPDKDAKTRVAWLSDAVRKYDKTRLVGQGCYVESALGDNPPKVDSLAPLSVMGWNYGAKYRVGRKSYPEIPVVYTESSSAFSTRGHYVLTHPKKKDQYDDPALQVDGYDLISANGPRDIPDYDFHRMEQDRYVAGEFVWTGFDYIGEPAPYERTAKVSYFGIVDLCGTPKDRFYLYRSHWNRRDATVHILPHWNWEDVRPTTVPVYVYTSGDSAELFLNGKSLGRRVKDPTRTLEKPEGVDFDLPDYYWIVDKYRLRWENVPYEPGVLEVVAYQDGVEIGRSKAETAGEVAVLRVSPEKVAFESDDDLVYVNIQAIDAKGRPCPWATNEATVEVSGAATLVGFGTGDPISLESFADERHKLFYGSATLILRSNKDARGGVVTVKVSSENLPDAHCEIKTPN